MTSFPDGPLAPVAAASQLGEFVKLGKVMSVKLAALWCDQGMAHVIEIYDNSSNTIPAALIVIDFGMETMFKRKVLQEAQAAPAVQYLMRKLTDIQSQRTPTIDLFIVSHQDTDHWSLIPHFVKAVKAASMPLAITKVSYGGDYWKKGGTENLALLKEYVADPANDYVPAKPNFSDYENPDAKTELTHFGPVIFRTLVVNAPTGSKKKTTSTATALDINGTSAVIVIEVGSQIFVLPGDATWETFKRANEILKNWTKGSPLMPCKVLSAPHHGALDTISNGGAAKHDLAHFNAFMEKVQPLSVVISAGLNNTFFHPLMETVNAMTNWIGDLPSLRHTIVVCEWTTKTWYEVRNLTQTVYTSALTNELPFKVANWFFSLYGPETFLITCEEFDGISKESLKVQSGASTDEIEEVEDDLLRLAGISPPVARPLPVRFSGAGPAAAWAQSPVATPVRFVPPPRRVTPKDAAPALDQHCGVPLP